MQIHLDEPELKEAILYYIENVENVPMKGRDVDITLTAGRGEKGHYADINLIKKARDEEAPFEATEVSSDDPAVDAPDPIFD